MKCGECLMDRVKMVDLVDGMCPVCGADYRPEDHPDIKSGAYHEPPGRGTPEETTMPSFDPALTPAGTPDPVHIRYGDDYQWYYYCDEATARLAARLLSPEYTVRYGGRSKQPDIEGPYFISCRL